MWVKDIFRDVKTRIGLFTGLIVFLLSLTGLLRIFELKTLDLRFLLRGSKSPADEIRVILIDEETMEYVNQYPFPRTAHADLIRILSDKRWQPKQIGFDLIFVEPSPNLKDDIRFTQCTKEAGNIYHVVDFHLYPTKKTQLTKLKQLEKILDKSAFLYEDINKAKIPQATGIIHSLSPLLESAKGIGHINIDIDEDGILRRLPLLIEYRKGKFCPGLALRMVCDYLCVDEIRIKQRKLLLLKKKEIIRKIPIDRDGRMLINLYTPHKKEGFDFKHYSFGKILKFNKYPQDEKILNMLYDLKDKIVLIGSIEVGKADLYPTSISRLYPAIGVHANIIENILQNDFIKEVGLIWHEWYGLIINGLIIILLGFGIGVFLPKVVRKWSRVIYFIVILSIIYVCINFWLFTIGIVVNMIAPLLTIGVSSVLIGFYTFHERFKEIAIGCAHDIGQSARETALLLLDRSNYDKVTSSLDNIRRTAIQLYDYSIGISPKIKLECIDINEIIKSQINVFSTQIKNKNIELELSLSQLPKLMINKTYIERALDNIISNAIKGIIEKKDDKERKLKILSYQQTSKVKIEISDTGVEIPKHKRKMIFDISYLPGELERLRGVGLNVTKKIIKRHGGKIYLKEDGEETTFVVELPIKGR
jgi:CHASE2 domain-containing sensor protein